MEHLEFILMKQQMILLKKTEIVENINKYEKIIGIGETGLDFYYNNSDKKSQIKVLKNISKQL